MSVFIYAVDGEAWRKSEGIMNTDSAEIYFRRSSVTEAYTNL